MSQLFACDFCIKFYIRYIIAVLRYLGKVTEMNFKNTILSFVTKNKKMLMLWGFFIVMFSMIFKGIMQQPQIYANKQKIAKLEKQIAYEKTRQEEIDELIKKVNTDEYIEKIAGEKLGLVKNNAKIFVDVASED